MSATQLKTQAIADGAITTPKIPDGQITQPKLAAGVGGNTDHSFRLRKNSSQSVPNAIFTPLTFDQESFDTDNLHSLSVNTERVTFTAAVVGKWVFTASAHFGGNSNGQRIFRIEKNGGPLSAVVAAPPGANNHGVGVACVIDVAAGDFMNVTVYHDGTGGSLPVGALGHGDTYFDGIRVAT